jgi:serine/threonine-protein kinase
VVLENKYRLLNEIGRGAMGTVFLAEDTSLKRKVAIKFLLPELDTSVDCAIRFQKEAVGMASVRDNNVAQIYSYAQHKGSLYFVMEYLDGETLEHLIDSHNRRGFYIPLGNAIDILVQAANGLSAIHRAGVVHRDIKPANIMIADNGTRVVIMDFGLVRNVEIEDEMRALVGTPGYLAPELAEDKAGADRSPLTDIYSLGVTAFELLTGTLPFNGESWVEIIRKHITEVPPFPSERRPGLPERVDEMVFRALSKDPKERFADCDELLEELFSVAQLTLPDNEYEMLPRGARATPTSRRRLNRWLTSTPPAAARATPTTSRGRLLVVDPDAGFRTQVHEVAKAVVPGCRIFSATGGEMALKMFDEVRPSAVLLDLNLPEINGFEVVATLRGDRTNDPVAIIVVTQQGGRQDEEIMKRLGVNRYLTKPVDRDTLAEELRPILERPLRTVRVNPPAARSW